MEERIVVGFDGSAAATAAVLWATERAAHQPAAIQVIGVYAVAAPIRYSGVVAPNDVADPTLFEGACRHELERVLSLARRQHPDVSIDVHAVAGNPLDVLLEHATEADLIVVGISGRRGLRRLLHGSVRAGLLRRSTRPVVVVPDGGHERAVRRPGSTRSSAEPTVPDRQAAVTGG